MELVAEVVRGHNVQEEDVLGLGVQAGHLELHLREHLPGKKVARLEIRQIEKRFLVNLTVSLCPVIVEKPKILKIIVR